MADDDNNTIPRSLQLLQKLTEVGDVTTNHESPGPVPPPPGVTARQWLVREIVVHGAQSIKALGWAVSMIVLSVTIAVLLLLGR